MDNNITQHSVWQLVKQIAQQDTRVRSIHYWDSMTVDPRAIELPALVFRYGQVRMDGAVLYATFHLVAFDRVLPDRSNVAQIPSVLTTILLDHHNQLTRNVESWEHGVIAYGQPTIDTAPEDEESVVKAQMLTFTLQLPDAACLTSLGFAPVDMSGEGYSYTGTTASSFGCADLSGCSLIQSMQTDISTLFTLTGATGSATYVQSGVNTYTGGTASRPTINVSSDPVFTTVSADTMFLGGVDVNDLLFDCADLSGCTVINEIIDDIASLSGLTSRPYLPIRDGSGGVGDPFVITGETAFGGNVSIGSGGNLYLTSDLIAYQSINVSGAITSGGTDLLAIFAPIGSVGGGAATYVQPGTNITTGGTPSSPIVSVTNTPVFTTVSATTFVQGGNNLSSLFAPISVVPTYVQSGTNITTGGTDTRPTVNLSPNPSVTTLVSSGGLSGGTIFSGAAELSTLFAPKDLSVRTTSGNYPLVLADDGRMIEMTGATAQNVIVPANASVAFPVGSQVIVQQAGTGRVTFSASSGVAFHSYSGYTSLAGNYAGATLVKKSTNTWAIIGGLSA